ncbi:hypothetical protein [Kibdelosporangium phytohabitans]|uniref:Secreted protein n=1 Tax=Kibdelosporangium phytohabitans TaxID=860235 RepID=A0A0N9IBU3_9PSEU|nr:hypothetical protein [Kibdelosporangium phytohabitans]ALG11979.1 hypothetical protein AOZ06_38500 [Kibdelosporangium phytohabitans]MBE1463446.1 hypothetical protein [Kibdelosporangium phytohabitans]
MKTRTNTFLLTVVAAGTLLLSACGHAEPGNAAAPPTITVTQTNAPAQPSGNNQSMTSGTRTSTKAPTGDTGGEKVQPVECGPVSLSSGAEHTLIADSTTDGRVGCTEAFTVFDEFVKLPADKRAKASLGNVDLSNGWSCTMDDGETTSVACIKGKTATSPGIALHTKPVQG